MSLSLSPIVQISEFKSRNLRPSFSLPETRPVVPGSATAIAIPVSSRRFTAEIESLTVGCVKDLGDSIRFFDRRNTNSPVSIDQ